MKNKHYYFLILFLLITTFSLKSAYWIPQKKMPYEIESIVRSIQWNYLKTDLKKNFQTNVGKIDFMMNKFPKDELYFISKTATYKYLLGNKPHSKIPNNFYETSLFSILKYKKEKLSLFLLENGLFLSSFVTSMKFIICLVIKTILNPERS